MKPMTPKLINAYLNGAAVPDTYHFDNFYIAKNATGHAFYVENMQDPSPVENGTCIANLKHSDGFVLIPPMTIATPSYIFDILQEIMAHCAKSTICCIQVPHVVVPNNTQPEHRSNIEYLYHERNSKIRQCDKEVDVINRDRLWLEVIQANKHITLYCNRFDHRDTPPKPMRSESLGPM